MEIRFTGCPGVADQADELAGADSVSFVDRDRAALEVRHVA